MIAGALVELANHGEHGSLEVIYLRLFLKASPREINQNPVGHELIEVILEVIIITGLQLRETQRGGPLLAAHTLTSLDILKVLELSEQLQRRWLEFI
jgi:hypothetical protein